VDAAKVLADLKSRDIEVRRKAASQIATLGGRAQDAIPDLLAMLEAQDAASRQAAVSALQQTGPVPKEAVPALTKALGSDREIRRSVIAILAKMGPEAEEACSCQRVQGC
jgi:HEAT repeat protein